MKQCTNPMLISLAQYTRECVGENTRKKCPHIFGSSPPLFVDRSK